MLSALKAIIKKGFLQKNKMMTLYNLEHKIILSKLGYFFNPELY
jgi:hypothetical protein